MKLRAALEGRIITDRFLGISRAAILCGGSSRRRGGATLGHDRTRNELAARLSEMLQQSRQLCATIGFAEQDPIYRQIKTQLIGREAYQYRLTVQEFCP